MISIVSNILEVAKSLIGLSDQLKAADRQRRVDMADLFQKISSCLASVSSEIRNGNVPHGRCGELITYSEALPGLVKDELGQPKAAELGDTLRSSYNVERLAMEISDSPQKEECLKQIEEASGKFQALANMVRAGRSSPR